LRGARTLTTELLRLTSAPNAAASRSVEAPPAHPLRAVSLARGLDARVWGASQTKPAPSTAKGKGVFAFSADSFYSFSHEASSVRWFVSHAWPDDCSAKVRHLRFLAVANLLGALFVACPLLACYYVPLVIALEGLQGVSWWVAPLLPLLVLNIACLWVTLSYAGLMPSTLTPWATSSITLWIGRWRAIHAPECHTTHSMPHRCACADAAATADKCCVDQDNIRGFLDGGLREFVLRSDRMVAFIGPKCAQRRG
jgi:hypothetical protein